MTRACTCHPDDNPPVPCAEKYAYSECVAAQRLKNMRNLIAERALKRGRKLTAREQLENLEKGLDMKPGTLTQITR